MPTSGAAEVHEEAARSYDAIAKGHVVKPEERPRAFRTFNNFVKKRLIQHALDVQRDRLLASTAPDARTRGVRVLDVASGRGGDMGKWVYGQSPPLSASKGAGSAAAEVVPVEVYHAYDISEESVRIAADRFAHLKAAEVPKLPIRARDVHFGVANCFAPEFWRRLASREAPADCAAVPSPPPFGVCGVGEGFFDIVSIQFAFHYSCSSLDSVQDVLRSVARMLAPGGVFVATIVDCDELSRYYAQQQECAHGAKNIQDGSSLFHIRFATARGTEGVGPEVVNLEASRGAGEPHTSSTGPESVPVELPEFCLPLGARYHFLLEGHVDCDEFAVPLQQLMAAARPCGLELDESASQPFRQLLPLYKMDPKLSRNAENTLSKEEEKLVCLYRTLTFTKKAEY